jgi:hypothetical protein
MGATLAHGLRLEKKQEILADGARSVEIKPIGGGYEFPTYRSVEEMVDYGRSKGIGADHWPVYYDSLANIEIEEVYQRCQRLRLAISTLPIEVIHGNRWLARVSSWLSSGQKFCITE